MHIYNPNITQEGQKNQKSEARLAYLHSEFQASLRSTNGLPGCFTDSSSWYARKLASSDKGLSRISFRSCQTMLCTHGCHFHSPQATGKVVPGTLGKLKTLRGVCKAWEKFVFQQLLPPNICTGSLFPSPILLIPLFRWLLQDPAVTNFRKL